MHFCRLRNFNYSVASPLHVCSFCIFHVFRCPLHPMSPDRFPVHISTSIFETPLQDLSPKDSILNISGYNMKAITLRKMCAASALRFRHLVQALTHEVKREATRAENTSRLASVVQAIGVSAARRGNPFFHRHVVVASLICGERPRRQKISSLIMPDFLPGASVQKRASHCTLSSVYLGRSNKKIEFL